ncbi:hypothetical protein [Streptomyces sp. NPDC002671]
MPDEARADAATTGFAHLGQCEAAFCLEFTTAELLTTAHTTADDLAADRTPDIQVPSRRSLLLTCGN